tara:strand:+ start:460 stop:609 length:150 start_codon:yes stop_codon:yes gene_type:complete
LADNEIYTKRIIRIRSREPQKGGSLPKTTEQTTSPRMERNYKLIRKWKK